jgi:hypothetical protein
MNIESDLITQLEKFDEYSPLEQRLAVWNAAAEITRLEARVKALEGLIDAIEDFPNISFSSKKLRATLEAANEQNNG